MSSAWNQLEQLLTCAICLDRFRNPKLLPCQHTFCGEPCMEGLVDYARRQIKCPECRAEHRIPYNGVQTFPNNVTLARFLDLHRGITGEEPEPVPSMMERCLVCSEKAFCERCAHCEKKVCQECRDAHLEILRREIGRINSQVRRGLSKLGEHAQQTARNGEKLQQNHENIREEITESVRRFIKDLKDKEAKLLHELDEYTASETKSVAKLKDDLEVELTNMTANCELAEKHITDNDEWTDAELVEYKEVFVKTLDFLRNLDVDASDFARKIKFLYKTDVDVLRRSLIDFGELKISEANGTPLSPSVSSQSLSLPSTANSLMRSQSDHRLAAQFQQSQRKPADRYLDISASQTRFGSMAYSDSERDTRFDRATSPTGRRPTDRFARFGGSVRDDDRESRTRFADTYTRGWPRPSDTEDTPLTTTHFRSRFMRERHGATGDLSFEDAQDSDYGGGHRSVRFEEPLQQQNRVKVFETEEAIKGPLSGVIKLTDSPFVMFRLHQNEIKLKLKDQEEKSVSTPAPTPAPPVAYRRPPSRQVSEDEIEKQKKQNQVAAAAATAAPQPPVPQSPVAKVPQSPTIAESPTRVMPRRVISLQKEDARRPSDSSAAQLDDSPADEDTGDSSGVARLASRRRPATDESEPSARVTSSAYDSVSTRSIRSPLAKNLPLSDTSDTKSVRPIGSDKKARQVSDSDNSDSSNSSSSESSESESEDSPPTSSALSAQARRDNLDARNAKPSDAPAVAAVPSAPNRRLHLTRAATLDDDPPSEEAGSAYSRYLRSKTQTNAAKDESAADDAKYGYARRTASSNASAYRARLAKSKSSHSISGYDESDEEKPTSPPYKSRYGVAAEPPAVTPVRKTSRSGTYTYRTRENTPPAEEEAVSVAQYLINKYGTSRSTAPKPDSSALSRSASILKSKSSHALYGRSNSSSDDDVSAVSALPSYRRTSREHESGSVSLLGSTASYGFSYLRSMYTQKKKMMMKIGSRGTEPGCFTWPRGVTCSPDNNIVVADSSNHRVQVFDSTGRFLFEFGAYGSGDGEFDCLASVCVNRIGQFVVSDRYNHRIQLFDPSGRFLRTFGCEGRSDGRFSYPWGVTTDALGFIYVCDKENHRVQVFQSDGTFVGKFGQIGSRTGQLEHPHYIAVSNTNRVVISDSNNHRIQIFDVNGRVLSTFGTEGSGDGQFKFPRGVAIDEQGYIVVGDSGNNRIQIFNPDGTFLKAFGTWGAGDAEFKGLEGVAISSTGNILVCDRENHRIQIF